MCEAGVGAATTVGAGSRGDEAATKLLDELLAETLEILLNIWVVPNSAWRCAVNESKDSVSGPPHTVAAHRSASPWRRRQK